MIRTIVAGFEPKLPVSNRIRRGSLDGMSADKGEMMLVLVLPGITSRYGESPTHSASYDAIVAEIKGLAPTAEVDMITYPGQLKKDGTGMGPLLYETSCAHVDNVLAERGATDVRLVGICYGSTVAASVCARHQGTISRAVFWAAVPFWWCWDELVLKEQEQIKKNPIRGAELSREIMTGWVPFETSIPSIDRTPCRIGAGDDGSFPTKSDLDYYKSLTSNRPNISYVTVKDAVHNMHPQNPGWDGFRTDVLEWLVGT
jgi:hypothetical protein